MFIRKDFKDLGNYDQVGRVLKKLVDEGQIIRIGYGLYTKARINRITGQITSVDPFDRVAKEALDRLDVDWTLPQVVKDYMEGKITQVPARTQAIVRKRFNRKISSGKNKLSVVYDPSAFKDVA